ncbi:MAG TPA: hypothetical protein VF062_28120 [Candidatus Limnocylindrales bacterium]
MLLGLCVAKYGRSEDGPTYRLAGDELCGSLHFDVFEPALGKILGEPKIGSPGRGEGVGCRVEFDNGRPITVTAMIGLFGSSGEAEEEYYANRSAVTETDAWDLQTSARKAQWSLGRFEVRGIALDGNLLVLVSFQVGDTFDSFDVHFGEVMAGFLRAALDEVRKANQVSV